MTNFDMTVSRVALQDALKYINDVAPKRATLPALACVLLEARADNSLRLTATDLEVAVRVTVPDCMVGRAGAVAVNAADLAALCKGKGGAVALACKEPLYVTVASEGAMAKSPATSVEDFPTVPTITAPTFPIPVEGFARALAVVAHAASTDETRYNLCGYHLARDDAGLRLSATDGHRLATAVFEAPFVPVDLPECIIPRAALKVLKRTVDAKGPDRMHVATEPGRARILRDNVDLIVRLVEGQFPNWRQVVPDKFPCAATFDTDALRTALKSAMTCLTRQDAPGVKLSVSANDGVLLTVQGSDGRTSEARIDATYRVGAPWSLGVNGRYLLDALATVQAGHYCQIRMIDDVSPMEVFGAGADARVIIASFRM